MLKVGSDYMWLWVALEPENRQILALLLKISKERNMFFVQRFIACWFSQSTWKACIQYQQMVNEHGVLRPVGS
jgi:hypothetical protein